MILVDEKLVLFFTFKIPVSSSLGLFDFSLEKPYIYKLNTAIEESTYIILKMGTNVLRAEKQSDIEAKENEKFLFRVKKEENFDYLLENPSVFNYSEYNTESLNNKLWYTINSENLEPNNNSKKNMFINEDYYLSENDIMKFGNIKYIVKQIKLNKDNEIKEKKDINIDFYPSFHTYYFTESKDEKDRIIKCEICKGSICNEDNPIIKFCSCNYLHYECLKKNIESNMYNINNDKVENYYFTNLKCKTCDFIFPLRFKLSEKKYELIKIDTPVNGDYIILESIEKKIFYGYTKLIHVIKLETEQIKIGRNKNKNDMIICDPSVSKEHALLIYKNEKILIKNLSKKFGTSVFVKNAINIEDKLIQIQTGKIMFETKKMKYKEFNEFKKKKKTKFPLPYKYY